MHGQLVSSPTLRSSVDLAVVCRSFAKQALLRGNLTRVTMLAKLNEHQTATLQVCQAYNMLIC